MESSCPASAGVEMLCAWVSRLDRLLKPPQKVWNHATDCASSSVVSPPTVVASPVGDIIIDDCIAADDDALVIDDMDDVMDVMELAALVAALDAALVALEAVPPDDPQALNSSAPAAAAPTRPAMLRFTDYSSRRASAPVTNDVAIADGAPLEPGESPDRPQWNTPSDPKPVVQVTIRQHRDCPGQGWVTPDRSTVTPMRPRDHSDE